MSPMWESVIGIYQHPLKSALESENTTAVGDLLCSMYGGPLIWGLDDWNGMPSERPWPVVCLALANSIGLGRLESPEQQNGDEQALDDVLRGIDSHFGDRVGRPGGGGMNGLFHEGRFIPRKFLEALVTCTSLMRMPGWPPKTVLEIGAGLGVLGSAVLSLDKNVEYHTLDLPIVSVMQAYMLSFCVGQDWVWLTGEERTTQMVLIHGIANDPLPKFDLVINQDSMPEMPHGVQNEFITLIADRLNGSGSFFSVNHEGNAAFQRSVHLAMKNRPFVLRSRHPYWGRAGYVEEVYQKS